MDIRGLTRKEGKMEIPERIKNARIKKGISQAELAKKIGVTHSAVCFWENGKRNVKLDTLVKISNALGCHLEEIAGYSFSFTVDAEDIFQELRKRIKSSKEAEIHFAHTENYEEAISARERWIELKDILECFGQKVDVEDGD